MEIVEILSQLERATGPFPKAAVEAAVGPDVLADDRHATGARHAAEPRQASFRVGLSQDLEHSGVVHTDIVAASGPFGKSRTAQRPRWRLPAPATHEAQQNKHQNDDQDDPQDAHFAPSEALERRLTRRTETKRKSGQVGYDQDLLVDRRPARRDPPNSGRELVDVGHALLQEIAHAL